MEVVMDKCIWRYGYRSNDDKNEYHYLGESPQFSLAVKELTDWAHEQDDYPDHLLYVTEYINGDKNRSLNLEEWWSGGEGIVPMYY
jgi:hypothetical protein